LSEVVPVSRDVDLLIEFPVIGRTYRVTGRKVSHDKEYTKHCSSSYSYYCNDSLIAYPVWPYSGDGFIIDIYK
jgi:hypothetical protein